MVPKRKGKRGWRGTPASWWWCTLQSSEAHSQQLGDIGIYIGWYWKLYRSFGEIQNEDHLLWVSDCCCFVLLLIWLLRSSRLRIFRIEGEWCGIITNEQEDPVTIQLSGEVVNSRWVPNHLEFEQNGISLHYGVYNKWYNSGVWTFKKSHTISHFLALGQGNQGNPFKMTVIRVEKSRLGPGPSFAADWLMFSRHVLFFLPIQYSLSSSKIGW